MTTDPTVITGPRNIRIAQMLVRKHALKLEILGLRRRGRQASTIIREELGVTTRDKKALLALYEARIEHLITGEGVQHDK